MRQTLWQAFSFQFIFFIFICIVCDDFIILLTGVDKWKWPLQQENTFKVIAEFCLKCPQSYVDKDSRNKQLSPFNLLLLNQVS